MSQWVLSMPFPLRFLFASQSKIMGIIYHALATHLIRKAGYTKTEAHTGAVTLIQRFDSALNLNILFQLLLVDDVYIGGVNEIPASFAGLRRRQAMTAYRICRSRAGGLKVLYWPYSVVPGVSN